MRIVFSVIAFATTMVVPVHASFNIKPFFTCVDIAADNQTATYYFGYESFEAAVVSIPVGIDNRFVPPPADRKQPILYFPGLHERAFRFTTTPSSVLWIFSGQGVVADKNGQKCQAAALLHLPNAVVSMPYSQKLFASSNLGPLTWSATTALPAGFGFSADGILFGTPAAAGQFTIGVHASDGSTSDDRLYQLNVTNGATIGDAASLRAPGFTPNFRVVTVPGASNTATARCADTEFLITGGGSCAVPNRNTIDGRIATSNPSGNGWAVTCGVGTATAVAVCSLK